MSKLTLVTEGDKPNIDLGVEEVKLIIKALKEIEEARVLVMADGKITISDFTLHPLETLYQPAMAIFDVAKNINLIGAEILRVDLNEADDLIKEVCDEFQITADEVKVKIANVLKAIYYIGEVVKTVV